MLDGFPCPKPTMKKGDYFGGEMETSDSTRGSFLATATPTSHEVISSQNMEMVAMSQNGTD